MKDIMINVVGVTIILVMIGLITFLIVQVPKWNEEARQKEKDWFNECLIKTNNNVEWCFNESNK